MATYRLTTTANTDISIEVDDDGSAFLSEAARRMNTGSAHTETLTNGAKATINYAHVVSVLAIPHQDPETGGIYYCAGSSPRAR